LRRLISEADRGGGPPDGQRVREPVTIRAFTTPAEYRACVALQEDTWGPGFSERVSPAILKVAHILGGVSSGAYDARGRLVGFVFGLTGVRDGEVVHWSDMLAVRPEVRDSGLGRRLKEYQREEVMRGGIEKMFWTFDPLQSRNAHLNITRLGAVVREYEQNMYGESDSPLHQGIGTDRFIALWWMTSERVRARLSNAVAGEGLVFDRTHVALALDADSSGAHPRPLDPVLSLDDDEVGVTIPADIGALMSDDEALAVSWREATRATFRHYLAAGYEVREFDRRGVVSTYLLTRVTDEV
jgi:predicted GNAT superfamily acetyltransferase